MGLLLSLIRNDILLCSKVTYEIIIFRYQSGGPGDEGDRASSGLSNEANLDGATPGRKTSGSAGGAAAGQTSKTISAPTSPLKEKKGAGFFGKVSYELRLSDSSDINIPWAR